jgi:hypothetical protein
LDRLEKGYRTYSERVIQERMISLLHDVDYRIKTMVRLLVKNGGLDAKYGS